MKRLDASKGPRGAAKARLELFLEEYFKRGRKLNPPEGREMPRGQLSHAQFENISQEDYRS